MNLLIEFIMEDTAKVVGVIGIATINIIFCAYLIYRLLKELF